MGSMRANPARFTTCHKAFSIWWIGLRKTSCVRSRPSQPWRTTRTCRLLLQRAFGAAPWSQGLLGGGQGKVFYTFKTRQVLRRVPCDLLFVQLAEGVGFELVECLDIELQKKNLNARPRSKDPYFESAIFCVNRRVEIHFRHETSLVFAVRPVWHVVHPRLLRPWMICPAFCSSMSGMRTSVFGGWNCQPRRVVETIRSHPRGYSVQNLSQEAVESLEGDERTVEGLIGAAGLRHRLSNGSGHQGNGL